MESDWRVYFIDSSCAGENNEGGAGVVEGVVDEVGSCNVGDIVAGSSPP